MKEKKQVAGMMNVDTAHSAIRVPVATALILGAFSRLSITRKILLDTGIVYLVIGMLGVLDKRVYGLLPSKLTRFDLVYHYIIGTLVTWLGIRPGRMIRK
jgi:hypothetical protein